MALRSPLRAFFVALAIAGCVVGGLTSTPAAAQSNCNSGNVANGNLLSSAACQASATGSNDTAVGFNAQASGTFSAAIGSTSNASGVASTAVGAASSATGAFNTSLGELAVSANQLSTALGSNSAATGDQSTAVGVLSTATGANTIAAGVSSRASGANATAIGVASDATGANSTAIGQGSSAKFAGSAAFGQGAIATRANQQVFGTTGNSYTLAGLNTTSTAAQVGPVSLVTADSSGTLGVTPLSALGIASQDDINRLQGEIDEVTQGVAMAAAIPAAVVLPGENFSLSVDWANYADANAVGLSSALRLASIDVGGGKVDVQGHVGVGFTVDGGGDQAVTKAGLRVGW
mgnify:CR=1 FL=1